MKSIIRYVRVSTKRQGQSGLGLEAQRTALQQLANQQGAKIIAEYKEVESGKHSDRPELIKAISHTKLAKATLCVAKLDRLARNVAFTSRLMETGVDFVAADNPHANRLTIDIMAALAEHEAKQISDRTKAALAEVKRRGKKLGSHRPGHWDGHEAQRRKGQRVACKRGAASNKRQADEAYAFLIPIVVELRQSGKSLRGISEALVAKGYTSRTGKAWTPMQIRRILLRAS